MSANITKKDGTKKTVKNLGWIIRNWKIIDRFELRLSKKTQQHDLTLIAVCCDSTIYSTDYACLSVCWNFLDRSIYRGLPCSVIRSSGDIENFVIGDDTWKAINKKAIATDGYRAFMSRFGL